MSSSRPVLLGGKTNPLLFVVSAPAGTGKTTIVEMLMKEFPCIKESVSLTTRAPRPNEINGVHYHFVTEEEFTSRVAAGEFLEHAHVFGHHYGTSRLLMQEQQRQGYHVILTIDTQGARQVKGKVPAVFIFLKPPSIEELRRRLLVRNTETQQVIQERLLWSQKEMEQEKFYDYSVVNDDLATTYEIVKSILVAEENRVR